MLWRHWVVEGVEFVRRYQKVTRKKFISLWVRVTRHLLM